MRSRVRNASTDRSLFLGVHFHSMCLAPAGHQGVKEATIKLIGLHRVEHVLVDVDRECEPVRRVGHHLQPGRVVHTRMRQVHDQTQRELRDRRIGQLGRGREWKEQNEEEGTSHGWMMIRTLADRWPQRRVH